MAWFQNKIDAKNISFFAAQKVVRKILSVQGQTGGDYEVFEGF